MDGFLFTESFLDTPLDEYGNPAPELMGLDSGAEIIGTYDTYDEMMEETEDAQGMQPRGMAAWDIPHGLRDAEPLGSIFHALEKLEAHEPDPGRTTEPAYADDWLAVELGGHRFTVPAEKDTASLTIREPDRFNILSDRDGDGLVDHIAAVSYDGTWTAWQLDSAEPAGAESGTIGGDVTPDQADRKWHTDKWECVKWGQWG